MNDLIHGGMAEATRLTQQGRLDEATAAIQRALGGVAPAASPGGAGGADEPIEVFSRLVKGTRQGPVGGPRASGWGPGASTQASPGPTLLSRGVQRPPGMATGRSASVVVPDGARFLERSYANAAGSRSYKLYVPSGYEGQEVSLVVMLHGCTQDPDDFAAGTHMNELAEEQFAALEKYGQDLTARAREGKIDPVIGRDDEIRRVIQVLSRRTKNNPVLIGEPGVGKTAIVEGLA